MALERVAIPSPNYSSRGGAAVRLIVLHTAEGAANFTDLGAYFANSASGVSSHVGIDDTPGTIGEYVPRSGKAWTAAAANPYSVQAELCAFAEWDSLEWGKHQQMLANTAAWIAEEAAALGIPITKLTASQAQGGSAGVCQHNDLGAAGGGHWDCGPSFPIDQVISMAKGGSGPMPSPSITEVINMSLTDTATGGVWVVDNVGSVFAYDGAPYLGGTGGQGYPCVGICEFTDKSGPGYCIVLDWGDADNDGDSADGGDRFRRYRFSRSGSGR